MSVTTTCRDVNELLPIAQTACKLLFQECYKAGITDIFITETYRSQARQDYLYAQGRTRPGNIVTWTKSSRHTSRRAWDIAVAPPKSLYDVTTLNKVGAIARKLGITWGGDWKNNIDRPHFEVDSNWKMPKGYKLEGKIEIPTSSNQKVRLITNEGGLTVSQYNELKSLINAQAETIKQLNQKVAQLESQLGTKERPVSSTHKGAWDWAKKEGLLDGRNPQRPLTREQFATVLQRIFNKKK